MRINGVFYVLTKRIVQYMEYADFKRLIDSLLVKNKETEWIEFKENFHSKEEIGERLSALSNSAFLCNMPYGYMVFGVNDDTLKVVGTDFFAMRKKVGNEELESWLSTRLNPRVDFEIIDNFDYEDKRACLRIQDSCCHESTCLFPT